MTISVNKQNTVFGLLAGIFVAVAALAVLTEQYFFIIIPFALLFFYAGWQNRNIVFLLLLFTLPLSFEYNFSSGLGTDIPDEFLMLLVLLLFILYWFYSPKVISKNILQHPLMVLLLIILCWTFVTVLFSTRQQISLKFLLAKSWYVGAFVIAPAIVFRAKKRITVAAIALVSSMLLVTGIALVRHYENNFSFATINEAVSPFFRNHVNYSAMLVCMLPVLGAFYQLNKKRDFKIVLTFIIAIVLIALFFSYARGAWLALLAGATARWLIKNRLLLYAYIAATIITLGLLFWIKENDRYLEYAHDYNTTIFHKDFSEHLIATYKLKDVSTEERFYRWIAGVRMIKDNWLTGFGPNTFYNNYKDYTVPAYKTWVSNNPEHSTVHNYFLLTTVEQGIPGLVFLLLLFGGMIYYAQKLYHRIRDTFYKTVAITTGVMLTMIIVVNSLSDLIETDKIGSLFFLCLATLIVTDVNTRDESDFPPHIKSIP